MRGIDAGKEYMSENEMDDYIDSSYDPEFDFSLTREEREELLKEQAFINKMETDFYEVEKNIKTQDEDRLIYENEKKFDKKLADDFYEDDIRKEFPIIYDNNFKPRENPSLSGCLIYLVFQGLILLIGYLLIKS